MVFDWVKAAYIIRDEKPQYVEAGLRGDWEWTGGTIWADDLPDHESYTFLSSTWATPQIYVDGDVRDCYVMQSVRPEWNSSTKWPEEALRILFPIGDGALPSPAGLKLLPATVPDTVAND